MNSLKEKGDLVTNLFSLPKKVVFNSYKVLFEKNSIGQAFLNSGITIIFKDERPESQQEETLRYEGGIVQYVKQINSQINSKFFICIPFNDI